MELSRDKIKEIINDDWLLMDDCEGNKNCDVVKEMARIALASLEAEPVCVIDQSNLDYLKSGSDADVWPASRTEMGDVLLYRAAPPAPVVSGEYGDAYHGAREDLAIWKRRALEAEKEVQRLSDINDYLVKEAQGETRMGEPVIREPAPVSVPDLKPVGFLFVSDDGAVAYSPAGCPMKGFNLIGPIYGDVNAYRAAKLHGSEPETDNTNQQFESLSNHKHHFINGTCVECLAKS